MKKTKNTWLLYILLFLTCSCVEKGHEKGRIPKETKNVFVKDEEKNNPPCSSILSRRDSLLQKILENAGPSESLFTIEFGRVVAHPERIDSFYHVRHKVPTDEVYEETIFSQDGKTEYQIVLWAYPDIQMEEGLYNGIQIHSGNQVLFNLHHSDAWDTIPGELTGIGPRYYMVVPLSDSRTALIAVARCGFMGPPVTTIIVLNGEEATWVYNQRMDPLLFLKEDNSYFFSLPDRYFEELVIEGDTIVYHSMQYRMFVDDEVLKIQKLGKFGDDVILKLIEPAIPRTPGS